MTTDPPLPKKNYKNFPENTDQSQSNCIGSGYHRSQIPKV